jgi:hypothetical protein
MKFRQNGAGDAQTSAKILKNVEPGAKEELMAQKREPAGFSDIEKFRIQLEARRNAFGKK